MIAFEYIGEHFNPIPRYDYIHDEWKFSLIKIAKSGRDAIPSSYRPISLLLALFIVFLKITMDKLLSYLENTKMILDYLFGLKPKHGTSEGR